MYHLTEGNIVAELVLH